MTVGGGEAADQMVRMMLSGGEIAVRLGGSALKNLLALTMALAKNNRTISGKVSMAKMLRETRDLRLFPMTPEQYQQFKKHANKQKILFSAIKDKDGKGKLIDVVMPVTELDRANLIFERIMYRGHERQTPECEETPEPCPEEASQERSMDRDRQDPQTERDSPWEPPFGASRRELPDDPWELEPPKKGSRSGRDSRDTRTRSSTRSDSKEDRMENERPSILDRLKGYRAQLDSRKQSVPARDKSRNIKRQMEK